MVFPNPQPRFESSAITNPGRCYVEFSAGVHEVIYPTRISEAVTVSRPISSLFCSAGSLPFSIDMYGIIREWF